ncbi:hypothetical protein KAH55_02050, partial [bacterium]|nr:hypothetical protein [bacterium]
APIVRFSELSGDPAAAENQLHSSGKVERELKNSHLYSLVMTGNYQNSAPNVQVSDSVFRYSLTSFKTASESDSNGSQAGLHLSCPLQSMFVSEKHDGIIPIDTNFIELEPDHVRLQIFKKTEKGKNWLLRLVETAGKPASIRLKFNFLDLEEAEEVTIVEAAGEKIVPTEGNTIRLECLPYELKSIRLKLSQPK